MFKRTHCYSYMTVLVLLFGFAGQAAARELPDFTQLIEDKSPAVVKINTITKSKMRQLGVPEGHQMPDIFRRFLDPRQLQEREMHSVGSGFFISSDGFLLTNHHVIDGVDEIIIRMTDRREFEAEVVGTDPVSDLALLKVDQKNLPYLKLAEKDTLRVGEWVVAIGSPFGMDFSASVGIVSAKGRSIPKQSGDYVPFVQTDVAINPGNSGGPLFNLDGEVVGVNTQIISPSGGSVGLSFAVPSELASNVVGQLKASGNVQRGWLGVVIQEVDKNLAESFGLKKPQGALVTRMEEGGPAEKGGLHVGDIIVKFGDTVIVDRSDLPHAVGLLPPGTKAHVVVMREGKRKQLYVKVGARGGDTTALGDANTSALGDRLGLVVAEVDPNELRRLRIRGGVKVREVDPDGVAAQAGIEAGDVIAQIGFEELDSVVEYEHVINALPENTLLPIRFFKRGSPLFRTITIGR